MYQMPLGTEMLMFDLFINYLVVVQQWSLYLRPNSTACRCRGDDSAVRTCVLFVVFGIAYVPRGDADTCCVSRVACMYVRVS